ncbi:MAG: TonB-dependent receptor [Gammaproteobacteria bacterium]|nr:TonB-dependent receptor [Gammaproteobacteria bacterium]
MRANLPLIIATVISSAALAAEQRLEDVLVTATHLPRAGSDLPLNWASIGSEDLLAVEHIHINESFQRIPGGWISRGNGQESLTALRSPVLTGAGSCGAFFVAADGLSVRAPGFCNVNQLFDANTEQAQRIEVIKGPGTALYGSGAMHGIINILSHRPGEQLEHTVALEAGPHDYYRGKYLYSNIHGAHGVVVALNVADDGGYKHDSGFEQQKVTLRHDYQAGRFSTSTIFSGANLDQQTAGFIQGYKAYKDEDRKKENPNPGAYREAQSYRLQSTLSLELDEQNSLAFTPYWRNNDMEFLQHFLPWQPVEENGHESLGLSSKWYATRGALDVISGIDLEYTDGWVTEIQDQPFSPNQPAGVHYDYQVDASLAALWSQWEWDLNRAWHLSAGARYEYSSYDYSNKAGDGPACEPQATACRFYRPADREDDFKNWSLNLGALYALGDSHSLYTRLARGFRAPQTTELYRLQSGQRSADLDAEELNSVELGLRGETGKFHYELGLYYTEKDDVIFQDSNRHNVSGASTLHYGVDFSLRWDLPADFDLAVDGTFARHQYDSDISLLGSSGDIKGNDIDTAPRRFGSLRLGWDLHANHRAELEWVHMDSYYLEPDNNHEYDGHNLLNLRLVSQLTSRLQLGLRGSNLTDEDYAERADFGFGNYRYFVGEPRSLYVQLKYSLAP